MIAPRFWIEGGAAARDTEDAYTANLWMPRELPPRPDLPILDRIARRRPDRSAAVEDLDRAWREFLHYNRVLDLPIESAPRQYPSPPVRALVEFGTTGMGPFMCGMLLTQNRRLIPFGERRHPPDVTASVAAVHQVYASLVQRPNADPDYDHEWHDITLLLKDHPASAARQFLTGPHHDHYGDRAPFFDSDGHPNRDHLVRGVRYGEVIDAVSATDAYGSHVRAGFVERLDPEALRLATADGEVVIRLYNDMVFTGQPKADRKALYVRQACERFPALALLIANAGAPGAPTSPDIGRLLETIKSGLSVKAVALPELLGDNAYGQPVQQVVRYLEGRSLEPLLQSGAAHRRSSLVPALPLLSMAARVPSDRATVKALLELPDILQQQNGPFRATLLANLRSPWISLPTERDLKHVLDFERWLARRFNLLKETPAFGSLVEALRGKGISWWLRTAERWTATLHHRRDLSARASRTWTPLTCAPEIVIGGVRIRELVGSDALKEEGKAMSHCVGSYDEGCMANRCRIFSLRNQADRRLATLEVGYDPSVGFVQRQVRACQDGVPDAAAIAAAAEFLRQANGRHAPWLSYSGVDRLQHPGAEQDIHCTTAQLAGVLIEEADLLPVSARRARELLAPLLESPRLQPARPPTSMHRPDMAM